MTTWQAAAQQPAATGINIPEGMQIAAMGRRVGAWIVDSIVLSFLQVIPFIAAIVGGAVSVNWQVFEQARPYSYQPWAGVTEPLLNVDQGKLVAVAVLWVAIDAFYFVGPWMAWGASLGQRLLSLKVVDKVNGKRLSFFQASVRWLVLTGAMGILSLLVVFPMLDWLSKTPMSELMRPYSYYYDYDPYNPYGSTGPSFLTSPLALLSSYGPLLWSLTLLAATGLDKAKRGWHDKIAGSIVVGRLEVVTPWAPGARWAPQPDGSYRPWPPQPQGYAGYGAWPPQPQGYAGYGSWPPQPQPQGYPGYPGWPPPPQPQGYPGYPGWPPPPQPQGYPGYPGWPPQAQPPAVPPAPPAVPPAPPTEPDK